MTVVLHSRELVFLKTRKTGGTAVELALSRLATPDDVLSALDGPDEASRDGGPQNTLIPFGNYRLKDAGRLLLRRRRARFYNHMPAAEVRAGLGADQWDRYLKVTVERDPYERAVSMWKWKTNNGTAMGLQEFLEQFPSEKLSNFGFFADAEEVSIDVILRHHRLQDDLNKLYAHLGIDTALAALPNAKNRGRTQRAEAADVLGEGGRKIVERACRRELAVDLDARSVDALIASARGARA